MAGEGKRYAVLNTAGVVINHIMIDDPMPKDYWPGYGRYLLCLDANPTAANPGITRLTITPSVLPQIGDTVNINTGQVTRMARTTFVQSTPDGRVITAANAPDVKLTKDIEPTRSGS